MSRSISKIGWKSWGKHAPDLLTNAEEMYYRALDVLPVELEDEIVLKDEITTYEQIHNFIIKKYAHKKHRAQQRQVIASRGRPSRMSPVVPSQETFGTPESVPKMLKYEEGCEACTSVQTVHCCSGLHRG